MSKPKTTSKVITWVELHREGRFFVLYAEHRAFDRYFVMVDHRQSGEWGGRCWPCQTLEKAKELAHKNYMGDLASRIRSAAEGIDWQEPDNQARLEAALDALEVADFD